MNPLIEQYRKELLEIALYSDDTVANYISCVYKFAEFIKQQFEIEPVNATAQHIRQWMANMKQTGVSNSRMNHHHSSLTGFFIFLEKMNRITENPTDGLFPLRRTKSDLNQPIDTETAYKLLKSVDRTRWIGQRDFMIISCLWALGLRRNELTHLKIKDFDANYDSQNKTGLLIINGKGRKQRALFVVNKLYENLVAYLKIPVAPTHLKKPCNRKYRPIFPGRQGAILTGDHILKIVRQQAQKAGITQRITPHVLRHSFATEMYLQNIPLNDIEDLMVIQDLLGHAIPRTTLNYYIHPSEKKVRKALEKLPGVIYLNELVESGVLKFQANYNQRE